MEKAQLDGHDTWDKEFNHMTSERCNKVFVLFVRVVQRLYDDANCIIENTV